MLDQSTKERLLELQQLDLALSGLGRTVLPSAERAARVRAGIEASDRVGLRVVSALDKASFSAQRREDDLRALMARQKRAADGLAQTAGARQTQNLQRELDSLSRRVVEQADRLEQAKKQRARFQKIMDDFKAQLEGYKDELNRLECALLREKTDLETKRLELNTRRRELVGSIPEDLLLEYEAKFARSGAGAARVVNGSCGGCRLSLTAQDLVEAAKASRLYACPTCDCFLFNLP